MSNPSLSELIAAIDDVLLTTLSVARDLSDDDAELPTECPAWNVRDVLAHMVGLEQVLQGAPQPTIDLPPLEHVRSDFDAYMERQVHVRRQLPLAAITDELAGLRPRRVATLRALAAQGDPEIAGPLGTRRLSESLPVRVFDLWAHEQDIRRAVGLPVRDECAAAGVALDRALLGWSRGLGRVEGVRASITVDVTGPEPRSERFEVGGGGPEVTIAGSLGDLTRAFCGRSLDAADLTGDATQVALLRPALGMTP